MRRVFITIAVFFVLLSATSLRAQDAAKVFEDAEKEAAWGELFDGATIDNLQIDGVFSIKDGVLILGGARQTKLQLKAPLGDQFKLVLECRFDGPAPPSTRLATRSFLAHGESGMSMPGTSGQWQELLYIRKKDEAQDRFMMEALHRKVGDKAVSGGGQFGGSGIPSLSWDVPAGTTLTIRKIRLQTTPLPGSSGLYMALIVLTLVLVAVAALGWFLNRRRPASQNQQAAG